MSRLLLFNCSNDLALASDTREYIPPKNVARMERDLAVLPLWWGDDGDALLFPDVDALSRARRFVGEVNDKILLTSPEEGYEALCNRAGRPFLPAPWGWSKAAVERFARMGVPRSLLPDDIRLADVRTLSSKRFAVDYISRFLSYAEGENYYPMLVGHKMRYVTSIDEVAVHGRTMFKSLWSSSGRGVFAADNVYEPSVYEKLCGFIKRQGGFVIDEMYDKHLDFALEYSIDDAGCVNFLGYSVFVAADNGYYGSNIVTPQSELRRIIIEAGVPSYLLDAVMRRHRALLSQMLGGRYSGVLGIDMLVATKDGKTVLHPCVEINLRMNLGIAAISLAERYGGAPRALAPVTNVGFNAKIDASRRLCIGCF